MSADSCAGYWWPRAHGGGATACDSSRRETGIECEYAGRHENPHQRRPDSKHRKETR